MATTWRPAQRPRTSLTVHRKTPCQRPASRPIVPRLATAMSSRATSSMSARTASRRVGPACLGQRSEPAPIRLLPRSAREERPLPEMFPPLASARRIWCRTSAELAFHYTCREIGIRKNLVDENWRKSEWKTEETMEKLEHQLLSENNLQTWRHAWQSWAISRGRHQQKLDPALMKEARILFDFFDRDGSGLLDMDELGAVFDIIGIRIGKSLLKRLLELIGKTQYDTLDFDSFLKLIHLDLIASRIGGCSQKPTTVLTKAVADQEPNPNEAEMREKQEKRQRWLDRRRYRDIFSMIDHEGNGVIRQDAIIDALALAKAQVSDDAIESLFRAVDKGVNDQVDFEDFVRIMQLAEKQTTSEPEKAEDKRMQGEEEYRRVQDERIRKAPIRLPFSAICTSLRRRTMIEDAMQKTSQLTDRRQFGEIASFGKRYQT